MSWASAARRSGDTSASLPAADFGAERPVRSVGKYRILTELGRGGMANVYLAVTHGPGGVNKLVVLKALLPDLATEPGSLTMFLDEARLAAQLNHSNVVQTYEVGTEGDRHVIVMEYLEGQSLASIVKRSGANGTPLAEGTYLRIIISVLEGLHYAHELSGYDGSPLLLVHRDVSPQNIFVTYDGQVKVLDFGIAKAASSSTQTASGIIKGKISYMAPEQMIADTVDRCADVYSVGCLLWAAAVGRKLWKDTPDVQVMRAVISGEIPSPQSVNPRCDSELNRIITKALAPDRQERYQSALELQEDLERYCDKTGVSHKQKELGKYVSTLFADTRAELKARVERQLSLANTEEISSSAADSSRSAVRGATGQPGTSSLPTETQASVSVSGQQEAAARGSKRWLVFAALAVLSSAVAFALWPKANPAFTGNAAATDKAPHAAVPKPAAPALYKIQLRALPSESTLILDGEALAGNPAARVMPADGKVHSVQGVAAGYQTASAEFTASHDDVISLQLVALPKARPLTVKPTTVGGAVPLDASPRKPATSKPSKAVTNCAQPFFIDSDGIKKIRPGCF